MIGSHRAFLYSGTMRRVALFTVGLYALFVALIGEYDEASGWLSFHAEMVRFDYVLHGFTVLKLMVVMAITIGWVYGTRWNDYDVFLLVRASALRVHLGRLVVLIEATGVFALAMFALFAAGWWLLPYPVDVTLWLRMALFLGLFTLYYNAMAFWLERLVRHPVGLFVPLLGYVLSLLFQDATVTPDVPLDASALPQLLWPDLLWDHAFRFGAGMVFAIGLIWLQCTWRLIQRQDQP